MHCNLLFFSLKWQLHQQSSLKPYILVFIWWFLFSVFCGTNLCLRYKIIVLPQFSLWVFWCFWVLTFFKYTETVLWSSPFVFSLYFFFLKTDSQFLNYNVNHKVIYTSTTKTPNLHIIYGSKGWGWILCRIVSFFSTSEPI